MRLLRSVYYAWQGISYCCRSEKNFRLQLLIGVIIFLLGALFRVNADEWFAIFFCSALVLSLEMINTAIEKLSDRITKKFDPVIQQVKDISAGAVCLVSIMSCIVGAVIFIPRIELFMKHLIK